MRDTVKKCLSIVFLVMGSKSGANQFTGLFIIHHPPRWKREDERGVSNVHSDWKPR